MTLAVDPSSSSPDLRRRPARLARWFHRVPWALLGLLALTALVAWDRWQVLSQFCFKYTDHDQVLLWYAADEAAHGRFHEPCFYGQAYSLLVEAWVAPPLLWLGLPHAQALPMVTCFLTLLPYLALAALAHLGKRPWGAMLVMLVPLVMPVEYDIVSSIPRGFVGGVALAGIAAALWLLCRSTWAFLAAGALAVLGLATNPNCCILLLAAGLYAWLRHFLNWRFYTWSLGGMLLAAPIPLSVWRFYHVWHPTYDYHPPAGMRVPLEWTWATMRQSFPNVDTFFAHFVPWNTTLAGWLNHWRIDAHPIQVWSLHAQIGPYDGRWLLLAAVFLAILGLLTLLLEWRSWIALVATLVFIVLTLGVNKVHDIRDHIWFSGSRMYLAVPVVLAVAFLWLDNGLARWRKLRYPALGVRLLLIGCALWLFHTKDLSVLNSTKLVSGNTEPLQVHPVAEVVQRAQQIAEAAESTGAHVVLLPSYRADAVLAYSLPPLTHGQVETLVPFYERRTWRLEQETTERRGKVLIYSSTGGIRSLATAGGEKVTWTQIPPPVVEGARAFPRTQIALVETAAPLIQVAKALGLRVRPYESAEAMRQQFTRQRPGGNRGLIQSLLGPGPATRPATPTPPRNRSGGGPATLPNRSGAAPGGVAPRSGEFRQPPRTAPPVEAVERELRQRSAVERGEPLPGSGKTLQAIEDEMRTRSAVERGERMAATRPAATRPAESQPASMPATGR